MIAMVKSFTKARPFQYESRSLKRRDYEYRNSHKTRDAYLDGNGMIGGKCPDASLAMAAVDARTSRYL